MHAVHKNEPVALLPFACNRYHQKQPDFTPIYQIKALRTLKTRLTNLKGRYTYKRVGCKCGKPLSKQLRARLKGN
jgi:hypothetical protein